MKLKSRFETLSVLVAIGLLGVIAGCPPPVDLCANVDCDDGFECDADTGECVAVDPCANVDCDDGFECDADTGECVAVDPCEGVDCEDGFECDADTGECVAVDPCEGVDCEDGFECDADTGECVAVDPCEGVACDPGETCVDGTCVASDPEGFVNASVTRGGSLYDKWWVVAGLDAPTDDHPRWAWQTTNEREGADTWRCKECHGWDYKGAAGAYGSGSHMTGFTGIFGTTLSAQEVFDKIETAHGFGDAGLGADDIWDLAKFVIEGQIDTDDIIDADNAFTGDVDNGQTLYDNGIGGNSACMICHGADGMTIEFHEGEFLGTLAEENPWEFQHKVRFGNPGTGMPASVDVDATNDDVADVGAYAQTLP